MSKFRMDFVTNSSSSSFICEICGNMESGMDCNLSDFDMVRCPCGHEFCEDHKLDIEESFETRKEDAINIIKSQCDHYKGYAGEYGKRLRYIALNYLERLNSISESDFEDLYEELCEEYEEEFEDVSSLQCPICQMQKFKDDELVEYFIKSSGKNKDEIKESIIKRFQTYYNFKEFIKD